MKTLIPALLALAPLEAFACGGFFCNRDFPIDQAGETVVFGVDDTTGLVTTHVSIAYEGASEDFAWIVPVAEQPELFTSSDTLFTALGARTRPQFWLNWEVTGSCDWGWYSEDDLAGSADTAAPEADGGGGNESVSVIAEEQVGPYDTVILQATDAEALLSWLNEAGYDLPTTLDSVLTPYLADRSYFVALKLSAGQDTGDLVPLGMRYSGNAASIPIQLTSVAATPDMPLTVYMLGDSRSVPDNYLHVTINDAAIDWFDNGSNYTDVISLAADEAGGHGFATDFAGSTEGLRGSVFWEQGYNRATLDAAAGPGEWFQALLGMGLQPSAALLQAFEEILPMPPELVKQGLSPQNFYDCVSCYEEYLDTAAWDSAAATDVLEARVIAGLREAEDLLSAHAHLTRMTSSLDADEMTIDPVFVFNRDIDQDQSNLREATLRIECGLGESWEDAERTLVLADGREIPLPSESWVDANNTTEFDLMEDLHEPAAIVIEDFGAEGTGDVVFDYREEASAAAARFRRAGCGCQTTSVSSAFAMGLVLLPLAMRRRMRRD